MFTWLVILCCHLVCGNGKTKSPCKFYAGKRDLKMEKIRSTNDAWKGFLKTWDWWNSQSFQGIALGPTREACNLPYDPNPPPPHLPVAMANKLTHVGLWPSYGHKTWSFMNNGGHQKCLDEATLESKSGLLGTHIEEHKV